MPLFSMRKPENNKNPAPIVRFVQIDVEQAGQRIDNFLLRLCKGVPKSHLYKALRSGEVRVNKGRIGADYRLAQGDTVRVPPLRLPQEGERRAVPPAVFPVVFEDEALLVVDKPAGVAVHGGSGVAFGVIEQLRAAHPDATLELAHRLDRETSGLLMIAKQRRALLALHQMMREGRGRKHYQALVVGDWVNDKQHLRQPLLKWLTASGERRVKVDQEGVSNTTNLIVGYVVASRITGPVRQLVDVVEQARAGTYKGVVRIETKDEIGTLSRTFNSLLTELREKEQMIGFLREGMTMMRKAASGVTGTPGALLSGSQETANLSAVTASGASTAAVGAMVERGGLFADRYEVLGTLGKGGMGVVYRAYDRKLDEEVALKVMRPEVVEQDPGILERFKLEIKLARRISHRNILRTHDFGDNNGVPFISMEYVEGVTLKDLVANKGALPIPVGLRIAKQMSAGLEAAHQQGVVHRDIKPQNMLILPESGELKIMDFGIARVSEVKGGHGLTSTGMVMGTPDYLPPEQAQGAPADFRSDVYSLGVVLFEIFTGAMPFTGDTPMSVVLQHIQTPPPAPRTVNPRLPERLEAVILRCLEKDPKATEAWQKSGSRGTLKGWLANELRANLEVKPARDLTDDEFKTWGREFSDIFATH